MDKTMSEIIREEQGGDAPIDEALQGMPVAEENGSSWNFGFLKAETGEGEIEEYLGHPLNFNNSVAVGRILRGLTGILGNLRLAVIDIGFGIAEFAKERRGNNG
ncbi:MAG: hypothetical protein N4A68_07500 [Maledivibacter sp.]|jgi:hypothetical protein|nr:hypothetical protein [Maledivibacter sp.]